MSLERWHTCTVPGNKPASQPWKLEGDNLILVYARNTCFNTCIKRTEYSFTQETLVLTHVKQLNVRLHKKYSFDTCKTNENSFTQETLVSMHVKILNARLPKQHYFRHVYNRRILVYTKNTNFDACNATEFSFTQETLVSTRVKQMNTCLHKKH